MEPVSGAKPMSAVASHGCAPAPRLRQHSNRSLWGTDFSSGDLRLDARQQLQQQLSLDSFPEAPALTSEHLLLHAWAKWGPVAPRLALLRERCTALLAKARYVSPENGWWRFKRNCVPRPLVALANARRLGQRRGRAAFVVLGCRPPSISSTPKVRPGLAIRRYDPKARHRYAVEGSQ